MIKCSNACLLIVICFIIIIAKALLEPVTHTVGAVFDSAIFYNYSKIFHRAISKSHSNIRVDGFSIKTRENLYQFLDEICLEFEHKNVDVIIVAANESSIHALNMVASSLGVPVIGYIMDTHKHESFTKIHHPMYLRLEPNRRHLARGLIMMLESNQWFDFSFIIDEQLMQDGFYQELLTLTRRRRWNIEDQIFLSRETNPKYININLSSLRDDRSRRVVIHVSPELAGIIFRSPEMAFLRDLQHLWILTEVSVTHDPSELHHYPSQCIALIARDAVDIRDIVDNLVTLTISSLDKTLGRLIAQDKRKCHGFINPRHYHLSYALYKQMLSSKTASEWGTLSFESNGVIRITNILIKYLIKYDKPKGNHWHKIGDIRTDFVKLSAIKKSGQPVIKPFGAQRMRYRVVTNPVKPFVMEELPHKDYNRCVDAHPCLVIPKKDKGLTLSIINDFVNYDKPNGSISYNVSCCRGLSINLLKELSDDLNFDFVLYLVADKTYGVRNKSGVWNGIIGDLMDGTAHFAVAAMSITRARSRVIDFTYPYFFSRFSVLLSDKKQEVSWYAFIEPFSTAVWCGIFLSGIITSIFISTYEWNSPFGLNPWGRKRKSNYTLGSGITMVLSILFGHTVKTKSPKAWPSKVLQNFWAPACIFILASYTANMASFIAGKNVGQKYSNIHDPKLLDLRIGILKGSAVESLLRRMNSKLYETAKRHYVPSSDAGITDVIKSDLDGYLGDHPILDYARAKLDPRCQLKLMKQTFGEDAYGLGVAKGSPLGPMLSEKIKEYSQSNVLKNLENLHFADPQCYPERRTQKETQLAVTHHAGLFVLLIGGFVVSIFVLIAEHFMFRWCIPALRLRPQETVWKSTRMLFFSQRLYRIITSAELLNPHDSAREILKIMKNREFSRIFQKSTIRKNRLADMAKAKRLNRNFFDIVEKAKWMQELREKNLIDDDSPEEGSNSPKIVEIQLKDLGRQVEEGNLKTALSTSRLSLTSERAPSSFSNMIACVQYDCNEEISHDSTEHNRRPSKVSNKEEIVIQPTALEQTGAGDEITRTKSLNNYSELSSSCGDASNGKSVICPFEFSSSDRERPRSLRSSDKLPNGHITSAINPSNDNSGALGSINNPENVVDNSNDCNGFKEKTLPEYELKALRQRASSLPFKHNSQPCPRKRAASNSCNSQDLKIQGNSTTSSESRNQELRQIHDSSERKLKPAVGRTKLDKERLQECFESCTDTLV